MPDLQANGWRPGRIGDICLINPDKRDTSWPHDEIEYIDISSVGTGVLSAPPTKMPTAEAPSRAQRLVRAGDTILATVRPNLRSFAYLAETKPNTVVSTGFAVLRAIDQKDQRFIYYVVSDRSFTEYLTARAHGSAYPAVSVAAIEEAEFRVPPPEVRHSIGTVLGALDDKIEQNRRTARALERLARAIFRAWFVDFEPVTAKAAGATAFPSMPQQVFDALPTRFVDSDLGPVPEGWEMEALSSVCTLVSGGTPKRSEPVYWGGDIPWYSVKDAPGDGELWVINTEERITQEGLANSAARTVPNGCTIISARGTVGKLAMAGMPMTFNQSCYGLLPGDGNSFGYLHLLMQTAVAELQQRTHGSVFDTITRATFDGLLVTKPQSDVVAAFETVAAPLFDLLLGLLQESTKLAVMRDYLLPKLLSGQVRVEAAHG